MEKTARYTKLLTFPLTNFTLSCQCVTQSLPPWSTSDSSCSFMLIDFRHVTQLSPGWRWCRATYKTTPQESFICQERRRRSSFQPITLLGVRQDKCVEELEALFLSLWCFLLHLAYIRETSSRLKIHTWGAVMACMCNQVLPYRHLCDPVGDGDDAVWQPARMSLERTEEKQSSHSKCSVSQSPPVF